jgi:hypothetical protein
VTKTRGSTPSERPTIGAAVLTVLVAGGLAGACGGAQTELTAAPLASDSAPRRPDGVVVEPPPAIPSAMAQAEARGVVALYGGLSAGAIRDCVEALMAAWQQGSIDALRALLASDAGQLQNRRRGPGPLVEEWTKRLRARDYRKLEGLELVRLDRVEHYGWSDLGAGTAPPRPAEMRPDETLVRVPVEVTQVAGEVYFPSTIVMLVRGERGRARIAAYDDGP